MTEYEKRTAIAQMNANNPTPFSQGDFNMAVQDDLKMLRDRQRQIQQWLFLVHTNLVCVLVYVIWKLHS